MLRLTGRGTAQTCDRITRRDFLEVGSLGAVGLSLAQMKQLEAARQVDRDDDRAAIMIFNLGAPSQQDLFDPKPDAPAEIRGPFKDIATASPELRLTEVLPLHAKHADKFSMVRACYHTAAAVHDTGHQMMQTGRLFTGGVNTPHAGSVLAYLRGRKTDLPAHVLMPETMGRTGGNLPHGQDGGFLGKAYDPFFLNADPSTPNFQVLRDIVDRSVSTFEASENAKLLDGGFESAFRMISSPQARAAFDLSKEPMSVRERYGMSRFGQCCLLARRLIEAGVRFVTINTFLTVFNEVTWDIHGSVPFTSIEGMKQDVCPMYDQGYTALLEDLSDRGLLDRTLVCNLSEFGRTPRVNPTGGRDHWPQCWTVYFAGGGVKGGRAVGASDPIGGYPAERPANPSEVVATIFHSLGFDLESHLPGPAGRPFPLVDFGTKPIMELF